MLTPKLPVDYRCYAKIHYKGKIMNRKFFFNYLFIAIVLLNPVKASTTDEPLVWAGCGITKLAFMSELASAYSKKYGTDIILEGGGATKGIRRINNQEVDIGGSCRSKIAHHPDEARAKLNPVAWDALVVIVHKDNPLTNITIEQLKDIYEGRIKNWRKLGGPDQPIELQVRKGNESGVGRTFRELIFGDVDKTFIAHKIHPSTGPLEKEVEKNRNAIAVTGISSSRKRDIKIVSLNDKEPSISNIRNGEYILYRPLYIVYNIRNPRLGEIKRFINFAHSPQGRAIIRAQGAVPYLDAINLVQKQREQWQKSRGIQLNK